MIPVFDPNRPYGHGNRLSPDKTQEQFFSQDGANFDMATHAFIDWAPGYEPKEDQTEAAPQAETTDQAEAAPKKITCNFEGCGQSYTFQSPKSERLARGRMKKHLTAKHGVEFPKK